MIVLAILRTAIKKVESLVVISQIRPHMLQYKGWEKSTGLPVGGLLLSLLNDDKAQGCLSGVYYLLHDDKLSISLLSPLAE